MLMMFHQLGSCKLCMTSRYCYKAMKTVLKMMKLHHSQFVLPKLQHDVPKSESNKTSEVLIGKVHQVSKKVPMISCKRAEYNHYKGQSYNKFEIVPLASKGWHHRQSKGDYFSIIGYGETPAMRKLPEETSVSFEDIRICGEIVRALTRNGISKPTNIQAKGIPSILSGFNTLLAAETGCGKTLAYLLPMLQQMLTWKPLFGDTQMNTPMGLIISPGRELAHQIGEVASKLTEELPLKTLVLTGGQTKKKMLNPSFSEVDLLVATLGALSKLTTTGVYRMHHVRHVVLDEADTLLDDSFNEKLKYFLRRFPFHLNGSPMGTEAPRGAQLTLASATMPTSMADVLEEIILPDSLRKVTSSHLHHVLPHVPQKFLRLGRSHKPGYLLKLVKADVGRKTPLIVFSNKSATCDWVSLFLNENGIRCVNLNGDMPLVTRTGKFLQFQSGDIDVLSCTDVGSRGLDTIRVQHVLNYDFPVHMADYIHRCGRTGRVGSSDRCHVTNFVAGSKEVDLVHKIELAVRKMDVLPNVNANITKIIKHRILRSMEETFD